jgi:hypothetical protein
VFADALCKSEQLQQLARLPNLQNLSLTYTSAIRACRAAPAWRQLSSLQTLLITDDVTELSLEEGQELLAAVGAATSLVELEVQSSGVLLGETMDSGVVCAHLTGGCSSFACMPACNPAGGGRLPSVRSLWNIQMEISVSSNRTHCMTVA